MGSRCSTAFGVAWPLALPAVAAVACRVAEPAWNQFGGIVLAVAALGLLAAPALCGAVYRHLPAGWPDAGRFGAAAALTVPLVCAQAYAGLLVFTLIHPGWVE